MSQRNEVLEITTAPRRPVDNPPPEADQDIIEPLDAFLPSPEDFFDDGLGPDRILGDVAFDTDSGESLLTSFGSNLNVVVIGATGTIGAALTSRLQRDPAVSRVYAFSRRGAVTYGGNVVGGEIDLTQERSIERAATAVSAGGPVSLVIVATGYLDQGDMDGPGDGWRALDGLDMANAFQINTIGPAFAAKHFLPRMAEGRKALFAVLADRPAQPTTAAQYAYRASKAALDSVIRSLAGELIDNGSGVLCAGLYPGMVDTSFSEPLLGGEDEEALAPEQAAERVIRLADRTTPMDSGLVVALE